MVKVEHVRCQVLHYNVPGLLIQSSGRPTALAFFAMPGPVSVGHRSSGGLGDTRLPIFERGCRHADYLLKPY
jgi:hypothetical protein